MFLAIKIFGATFNASIHLFDTFAADALLKYILPLSEVNSDGFYVNGKKGIRSLESHIDSGHCRIQGLPISVTKLNQ